MFQERSMSCYSCLVLYLHGFTEQRSMSASEYNNKCEMRYFAVCQAKKSTQNEHARIKTKLI